MNPTGKCRPGGPGSFMKISANFIYVDPLKKPNFSSVWDGSLSRWLPFEHSSTKMGSLDIDPVYSTLCPRITSTHSASKFHLNMLQYSVGGALMPNALTYSQDCTTTSKLASKRSSGCVLRSYELSHFKNKAAYCFRALHSHYLRLIGDLSRSSRYCKYRPSRPWPTNWGEGIDWKLN